MIIEKVQEKKLIDKYSRYMHKLRVQLTDECNFRCFYCMPRDVKFQKKSELLTASEIFDICSILNEFGIDEIRVTGGEPTIRQGFEEIISNLSSLNLKKLGLTTNGFILNKKLPFLKETNCKNINISLDSLQEDKFNKITYSNKFKEVYSSILKAKELGFNVKINTVLLGGVNDDEIFDFIKFSANNDIEVRFIELMKIGQAYKNNTDMFIPADEVIKNIENMEELFPVRVSKDSTSFRFKTSSGARIGFIASESRPFCHSCSRLRLSATGKLRACIMSESGVDIRRSNKEEYEDILSLVMGMKPIERINHIEQSMNEIGG